MTGRCNLITLLSNKYTSADGVSARDRERECTDYVRSAQVRPRTIKTSRGSKERVVGFCFSSVSPQPPAIGLIPAQDHGSSPSTISPPSSLPLVRPRLGWLQTQKPSPSPCSSGGALPHSALASQPLIKLAVLTSSPTLLQWRLIYFAVRQLHCSMSLLPPLLSASL
jgi:hypothetical protein